MSAASPDEIRVVDPAARPRRRRFGVRVIVTDGSAVLLLIDSDPGIPGSRWYVTPGGGVDAGESARDAAVRELAEETGLGVLASELNGPIAHRVAVHGYSDKISTQDEEFFVLRTARFTPDGSGHTAAERQKLLGHAWVSLEGLAGVGVPVWPVELAAMLERWEASGRVWELGEIEESTVPVGRLRDA